MKRLRWWGVGASLTVSMFFAHMATESSALASALFAIVALVWLLATMRWHDLLTLVACLLVGLVGVILAFSAMLQILPAAWKLGLALQRPTYRLGLPSVGAACGQEAQSAVEGILRRVLNTPSAPLFGETQAWNLGSGRCWVDGVADAQNALLVPLGTAYRIVIRRYGAGWAIDDFWTSLPVRYDERSGIR